LTPSNPGASVLVIGSANVDLSLSIQGLPQPGETVFADAAVFSVGGKGANQAVAAAACGAHTRFIARVGDDAFGRMVRDQLDARGVHCGDLRIVTPEPTGLASICVDRNGQNCIVVAPGANLRLTPRDIDEADEAIRAAGIVVLQCESPFASITCAVKRAIAHGVPVILNPAPCRGIELTALPPGITYLVPNEAEAALLGGMPVNDALQAAACASRLREAGIDCVIITLGARGSVIADGRGVRHQPAHAVTAVDTTGAGDAFIGCLAAGLAAGMPRDDAVRRAGIYAALSTTRPGAQMSYPTAEEFAEVWSTIQGSRAGTSGSAARKP
jgi:ribokinase